jgi:hypothetical protein
MEMHIVNKAKHLVRELLLAAKESGRSVTALLYETLWFDFVVAA